MRRGRAWVLLWLTALLAAPFSRPVLGGEISAEVPEGIGSLEDYIGEEYFGEGEADDLDMGDTSRQEIDQIIEDFFEQMDNGSLNTGENQISGKITDPPLKAASDGRGGIRYTLPSGAYFTSTVPDGMVSGQPVELDVPGGAIGVVRHNDGQGEIPDAWRFTEPGSYSVKLLFYRAPSRDSQDYNVYEVNFSFVIAGSGSSLGAAPAPQGFRITGVRKNGRMQAVENEDCVFLQGDGPFEILYTDRETGTLHFQTSFVRDTTAPFLSFSQDPGTGPLTVPVHFTPSEPGCRVSMSYNGNKSYVLGDTLKAAGNYELSVEDGAGNRRVYYLRIRQTYKLVDVRLVIIAFLVLAGTAARMLYLRRNMRVL